MEPAHQSAALCALRTGDMIHHLAPGLLIALITLACACQFALIDPDFHHDGFVLQPGIDFQQGRIPFRDSYQQYGLGESFFAWMIVAAFGESLLALRLSTALCYSAIAFLLWVVWRRFLPAWLTTLTCLIWLGMSPYFLRSFLPWSSVRALLFEMLSLYYVLRFVEKGRISSLFFAGLLCGMIWLCRWTVGTFLFVSLSFFLVLNGVAAFEPIAAKTNKNGLGRQLLFFCLGFFLILAPSFLFLVMEGALRDSYLQTVSSHLKVFNNVVGSFHETAMEIFGMVFLGRPNPNMGEYPTIEWSIISLVCLFMFLRGLCQLGRSDYELCYRDRIAFLLAVAGLGSLMQYYPVPCPRHLFWAASPVFGLLSYALWRVFRWAARTMAVPLTVLVLCLVFGQPLWLRATEGWKKALSSHYVKFSEPMVFRGMKTDPANAKELERVLLKIDELESIYPEKCFVIMHPDPIWNLLVRNVCRFHQVPALWQWLETVYPDYQENLKKIIRTQRPILLMVSYDDTSQTHLDVRMPDSYFEIYRAKLRPLGHDLKLALPTADAARLIHCKAHDK